MQERIKEHNRDTRLARTQTSAVSKHAHYPICHRDPHWHTRRVKEAFLIRLHPNSINRDSGIEIPEAWISVHFQKAQRKENGTTADRWGNSYSSEQWEDRNAPITADLRDINGAV